MLDGLRQGLARFPAAHTECDTPRRCGTETEQAMPADLGALERVGVLCVKVARARYCCARNSASSFSQASYSSWV
jgi:hypothetical protein